MHVQSACAACGLFDNAICWFVAVYSHVTLLGREVLWVSGEVLGDEVGVLGVWAMGHVGWGGMGRRCKSVCVKGEYHTRLYGAWYVPSLLVRMACGASGCRFSSKHRRSDYR